MAFAEMMVSAFAVALRARFYLDKTGRISRQEKILKMTPSQCRAARALLDLTQPQLAELAGLGLSTIYDFEKTRRSISNESLAAIRAALEAAGVVFTNGDEPGVKLKAKK